MASKKAAKPTLAQAQLQLQLYDLRREPMLRRARHWLAWQFPVKTVEELNQLSPKQNGWLRMAFSYWEQACQMLDCGLLDEDLFFQTTNEFFIIWERTKPIMLATREKAHNPIAGIYTEKAAKRYEIWINRRAPGFVDVLRQVIQQTQKPAPPAGKKQGS